MRTVGADAATVCGMRSAFRDWAAEQTALPGGVVEAAPADTIGNKAGASYRRTNYLEKRRGLMDTWAAFACPPEPDGASEGPARWSPEVLLPIWSSS